LILADIVAQKRIEVAALKARTTPAQLQAEADAAPRPRDFAAALRAPAGRVRLIAEVKRKSPSKGVFRADLDAAATARAYAAAGAACISVLTDEPFFAGTLADLRAVRQAVDLPLLRKDFIIDEMQIVEARTAGADAILLIAAILDDAQVAAFHALAASLGMAALVEVHDAIELRRVLPLKPALVGINNRDLRTFRTNLATTETLAPQIPANCVIVGESGIHTHADVERLRRAGARAILVGESLILADSIAAQAQALIGGA